MLILTLDSPPDFPLEIVFNVFNVLNCDLITFVPLPFSTQNIIEHVTGENGPEFVNGAYFYRFVRPLKLFDMEFVHKYRDIISSKNFETCFATANAKFIKKMEKMAEKSRLSFERHKMIQDRKWRLKTYLHCFVGEEAVSWMVGHKICGSRNEGIQMGQMLVDNNVWRHVVDFAKPFMDDEKFYEFVPRGRRGAVY